MNISPSEVHARVSRLIVHHFDPEDVRPGGVETCISDLIAFAPDDTTFAVAGATSSSRLKLGRWSLLTHRGRDVFFVPIARLGPVAGRRIPHSLRLAGGLVRTRGILPKRPIQTHRVDVAAALTTIAGQSPQVQFIHSQHGAGAGVLGQHSDSFWRHAPALHRSLEARSLRTASVIVVFGRAEASRVRSLGCRPSAWQTWYDPAVFRPKPKRMAERLRVAWIGRFERSKDPLLAVDVADALRRRGQPATLTVLGGGGLGDAIERRVVELGLGALVEIRPSGDRHAVAQLLQNVDVLLGTSHYEGSPRVLIESLATGTPVAATAAADPDGLLSPRNGARVETRDPDELADAVLRATSATTENCAASVRQLAADRAVPRLIGETEPW